MIKTIIPNKINKINKFSAEVREKPCLMNFCFRKENKSKIVKIVQIYTQMLILIKIKIAKIEPKNYLFQ